MLGRVWAPATEQISAAKSENLLSICDWLLLTYSAFAGLKWLSDIPLDLGGFATEKSSLTPLPRGSAPVHSATSRLKARLKTGYTLSNDKKRFK